MGDRRTNPRCNRALGARDSPYDQGRALLKEKAMSRLSVAALIGCLLALFLVGCNGLPLSDGVRGSGKYVTRDFDVTGFDAVDVSDAFDVTLTPGDAFKVSVTTDDNLMDYVTVQTRDHSLSIGFDHNRLPSHSSTKQEVTVTLPALKAVTLNGASSATMAGFPAGESFKADVNGAGKLRGQVEAGQIDLNANGAGMIDLTGKGTDLRVDANGGSSVKTGDLAVQSAQVTLNGGATAAVQATTKLDYDLSGGARLTYSGSPRIGASRTSGGAQAIGR